MHVKSAGKEHIVTIISFKNKILIEKGSNRGFMMGKEISLRLIKRKEKLGLIMKIRREISHRITAVGDSTFENR